MVLKDCRKDRQCPQCTWCDRKGHCYEQTKTGFKKKFNCVYNCQLRLCEHCEEACPANLFHTGTMCWFCEMNSLNDPAWKSKKSLRCDGRCWQQQACEPPFKYYKTEKSCPCRLLPCKECRTPTPNYRMPFAGYSCPTCQMQEILGEEFPVKQKRSEEKKESSKAFCGICKKVKLKKEYACGHYSCVDCYNKMPYGKHCSYCEQRIK